MKKRTISGVLAAVMCFGMTACASPAEKPAEVKTAAQNLSKGVTAGDVTGKSADDAYKAAQTRFALGLLQKAVAQSTGENAMLSPYSVTEAIAMTANGAGGDTLTEMETVLGGLPLSDLREYLLTQRQNLPNTDKCKLTSANSIWLREGAISVKPDFLQSNADYFGSEIFQGAFDDKTVEDINKWVSGNTDGMIPQILDAIPAETVMYLINAVCFDAKWETQYTEDEVTEYTFTNADNSTTQVQMMRSQENTYLFDDSGAQGFYKPYEGGKYAFAGILPAEGVSAEDYVQELTPDCLQGMLAGRITAEVEVGIPEFSSDYSVVLNDTLREMGMPTAFTGDADFTNMADEGNDLYIGKFLHKTHIEVDPKGTKAAAVTMVQVDSECCVEEDHTRYVILNRPFVYMIVDTETDLPVFIGVMNKME